MCQPPFEHGHAAGLASRSRSRARARAAAWVTMPQRPAGPPSLLLAHLSSELLRRRRRRRAKRQSGPPVPVPRPRPPSPLLPPSPPPLLLPTSSSPPADCLGWGALGGGLGGCRFPGARGRARVGAVAGAARMVLKVQRVFGPPPGRLLPAGAATPHATHHTPHGMRTSSTGPD